METLTGAPDFTDIDLRYKPFPEFSEWAKLFVDVNRWQENIQRLEILKGVDSSLLAKAREVAKRAAAVDTGALEGLYKLDDGFTITVATQTGMWQAAYQEKEDRTRNLIEAQLAGYDQVIDLATQGVPMAEVWIRQLHATICVAQETYAVITDQGEQQQALPLGVYKKHPNHVVTKSGQVHPYAPVIQTEAEMQRFVGELRSDLFVKAHPLIQAAFVHYTLVWIHPFSDGNGRTARALASVYTYRAASIPFMVLMEHKSDYLAALRASDSGNYQSFVDFSFRRSVDAFQLVVESLRAAKYPLPDHGIQQAMGLHVTPGGYAHAALDNIGASLIEYVKNFFRDEVGKLKKDGPISLNVGTGDPIRNSKLKVPSGQRKPADPNVRSLSVRLISQAPAEAQFNMTFYYSVPVDAKVDDEFMLIVNPLEEILSLPVGSLVPRQTTVAQLKLKMFLQGVYGAAFSELNTRARESLGKSGYV